MPSFTDLLAAAGLDADTSARRLAEYSYDASNYRVPPSAVVFPRSAGDVLEVLAACRATGTPLTARGGGTGMAGNAIGTGVVLDFSRHLDALGPVDEAAGTVQAGAGAVLSRLTGHVERATGGRLTFAPDPSSRTRATVGGALGNDACGNHSVRHGRTSDHVAELDLVTADGFRLTAGRGFLRATDPDDGAAAARADQLARELQALVRENLAPLRTELERIPRQVSGYHLAALLPEHGFDVARALVGSEGTCAVVVGARMRLVEKPASALLVCLGYADVVEAARDVPEILTFNPAAVEGIDDAIVQTMRFRRGADSVTGLPNGKAWLYVDLDGEDPEQVRAQAAALLSRLRTAGRLVDGCAVPDPAERASLWRVREDGAGLSSRLHTGGESWPGWEDSAVAPQNLADYLSDFRLLLERHGLQGVMYGHFGAGCMHIRITYDLRSEAGRAVFRAFSRDAADLVVAHGGSLSGEHGDGRARSEFLPVMYSPRMLELFARFRRIWDPTGLLNPGAPTDPPPIDADLALAGVPDREWRTHFELHPRGAGQRVPTGHDPGSAPAGLDDWTHAVQGCIGVGRCRSDAGGFMCPSYRATRNEKDSTRGRARVLQEMVRGARTVAEGWRSPEVLESLDLCLSCKACSTDCPVGVDMATYKAEFLSHHYSGRLRPASHYSLGWLPRWLRLAGPIAPLVNAALATPLRRLAPLAGVTAARPLPDFAPASAWRAAVHDAGVHDAGVHDAGARPARSAAPDATEGAAEGTGAVLFVDTFTRGFRPEVAGAAARVLAAGGPVECAPDACCGLTWITTGQLGTAKRKLAGAAAALDDGTQRPIVVVEPSCAAALRKDLPELVPTDQARRVAARVRSFAAHAGDLAAAGRLPEPAAPLPAQVVLQTHCHEYATFGAGVQRKVLEAAGVSVREASGCCGVAGNFGFESEHFALSMQVAEQSFAPALRETGTGTPVLTDGFSCSRQAAQLDPGRPGRHLAQLLDPGP
ncbi:lactate dehydrogenase [Zafaria cholistanensis]|uniref:Lactate dehydrogenase n=1 Tax=Zafaria cholistanensis TaxID=1682741 RepID=A0A5A7NQI0_9MICC|nr:FAD-binding and (Fe-S)-binding domain-containing protein [Zafaria cholistanensis]GER22806.1 lactate dehydrogenase [Zafaria cholistanensis]